MGVTRCWFFPPLETLLSLLPTEHLSSVLLPWSIIGKRRWRSVWAATNWKSISIMAQTGFNVQKCKCRSIQVPRLPRPMACACFPRGSIQSELMILSRPKVLLSLNSLTCIKRERLRENGVLLLYPCHSAKKAAMCAAWHIRVVSKAAAAFPGRRGSVTGISWWWISDSKFTFFFC